MKAVPADRPLVEIRPSGAKNFFLSRRSRYGELDNARHRDFLAGGFTLAADLGVASQRVV